MQTRLDKLLSDIRPERTIVETFNRANEAINTFRIDTAQIEEWDEFKHCMAEFMRHVDQSILKLRRSVDASSEYYWSHLAQPVLCAVYGSNGQKAAFEMARTGNGGGLYAVLRAAAMNLAERYSKIDISAKVNAYIEDLSVDEQLDACSEYISKHSPILPSELTEGSAARIRADFGKVLERHPWLIKQIHEVGR